MAVCPKTSPPTLRGVGIILTCSFTGLFFNVRFILNLNFSSIEKSVRLLVGDNYMASDIKPLKRSEYSEDVELQLRKIGKDYCEKCGEFLHGSEVSPERLKGWVEGREKAICPTCRNKSSLTTRILTFVGLVLITIIMVLIF